MVTQLLHEVLAIVSLVGTQCDPMLAGNFFHHRHRRPASAVRRSHATVDHQAVAILHQHVPCVSTAWPPCPDPCGPAAPRGRWSIGGSRWCGARRGNRRSDCPDHRAACSSLPSLRLKLLWLAHASIRVPSTVKCSVESRPRLRACASTSLKNALCHLGLQQPLPVLGEYRHVPHRVVDVESHKPAKQQIVIELLHQHPLAAHRIKHLQQQRPQQLLRRNRRPPAFA